MSVTRQGPFRSEHKGDPLQHKNQFSLGIYLIVELPSQKTNSKFAHEKRPSQKERVQRGQIGRAHV